MRTPCSDKSGLRKGTWSPEEDRKLIAYITRYGYWNWRQLPKYAGLLRCGKSCRLRWMNYLRPDIKRGNFSKEEDDIIINLHESLGNRWSAIAAQLPGRTDNDLKNHWHTYLKKRSKKYLNSHATELSSSGLSKRKSIQGKKSEASYNSSADLSSPQIFESSQLSSHEPSSSETSSSTMDSKAMNCKNFVAENDVVPSELFAESSGSFWTEPFWAENNNSNPDDFLAPLIHTQSIFPCSPVIGEEFLCSYGLYDEHDNVLNW